MVHTEARARMTMAHTICAQGLQDPLIWECLLCVCAIWQVLIFAGLLLELLHLNITGCIFYVGNI